MDRSGQRGEGGGGVGARFKPHGPAGASGLFSRRVPSGASGPGLRQARLELHPLRAHCSVGLIPSSPSALRLAHAGGRD